MRIVWIAITLHALKLSARRAKAAEMSIASKRVAQKNPNHCTGERWHRFVEILLNTPAKNVPELYAITVALQ